MTASEYLVWERLQKQRHEFFSGQVFAMAGGSHRHNVLCAQLAAALNGALREAGCFASTSDQRVGLGERYVYPDVAVACRPIQFEPGTTDVLANPSVIVEVLSSSTEQYDRGLKWAGYQQLASLRDYLLVAQDQVRIEHFQRNADASWSYRVHGAGAHIALAGGRTISVDAIYADVFELEGE